LRDLRSVAADDDRISVRAWLTLVILGSMLVLSYLDRGILSLLVEPIRKDLHITDVDISLLQGLAFGVFYALFAFPLGWLADRYSRRGVIFFCITGWSLATTACGLAGSFWQLAAARLCVGIGEGGLSPAAYRIIGDLFPPRRLGMALGIFSAGASLGLPVAIILGGAIVTWAASQGSMSLPLFGDVQPWQLVFLVLGPPGLLIAPLIFIAPRGARVQKQPSEPAAVKAPQGKPADGYGAFLRSRMKYLTLHFSGYSMIAMIAYGAGAWAPTYFQRRFGLSMVEIGLFLGVINAGCGMIGHAGWGWVVDRWFSRGVKDAHIRLYAITFPLIGVGAVVAYGLADSPLMAFAALPIVHLLMPFTAPAVGHLQLATPVEYRGRTTALFTMVFNIVGAALGPLIVAILTEHVFRDPAKVGLSIATMAAAAAALGTIIFVFCLKPARNAISAA
jgi:MFS family permease